MRAGSAPTFAFPPATTLALGSGAVPPFGSGGAPAFGAGAAPASGSGGATAGPSTAGGAEPEGEPEDTGANEPNVRLATAARICEGPGKPSRVGANQYPVLAAVTRSPDMLLRFADEG